jgi:hypothetical protein
MKHNESRTTRAARTKAARRIQHNKSSTMNVAQVSGSSGDEVRRKRHDKRSTTNPTNAAQRMQHQVNKRSTTKAAH